MSTEQFRCKKSEVHCAGEQTALQNVEIPVARIMNVVGWMYESLLPVLDNLYLLLTFALDILFHSGVAKNIQAKFLRVEVSNSKKR
jgi:hypothetical protein